MGATGDVQGPGEAVLVIDCAECVLDGTDACADCVVTWLVEREPGDAVVIDVAEVRALRVLEQGGLVPTLRHARRTVAVDGSR